MKKQCLSELTKKLSLIEKSQIMRKEEQVNKIAGFLKNSYGLLVEGL